MGESVPSPPPPPIPESGPLAAPVLLTEVGDTLQHFFVESPGILDLNPIFKS